MTGSSARRTATATAGTATASTASTATVTEYARLLPVNDQTTVSKYRYHYKNISHFDAPPFLCREAGHISAPSSHFKNLFLPIIMMQTVQISWSKSSDPCTGPDGTA